MAKDWLQKSLATMNRADIPFSIATKGYHLRILFGRPLFEDRAKEQQVFKNFAYLMMQLLRTKFKKGFAGFKVVLKST